MTFEPAGCYGTDPEVRPPSAGARLTSITQCQKSGYSCSAGRGQCAGQLSRAIAPTHTRGERIAHASWWPNKLVLLSGLAMTPCARLTTSWPWWRSTWHAAASRRPQGWGSDRRLIVSAHRVPDSYQRRRDAGGRTRGGSPRTRALGAAGHSPQRCPCCIGHARSTRTASSRRTPLMRGGAGARSPAHHPV